MISSRQVPATFHVRLNEEALTQALHMAATTPTYAGCPLRVYIEGKGCDGFYYGVAFDTLRPDDFSFQQGALTVIVDPESFRFLHSSTVLWIDDERGRGFLVDNPNHRQFRGKFFKR